MNTGKVTMAVTQRRTVKISINGRLVAETHNRPSADAIASILSELRGFWPNRADLGLCNQAAKLAAPINTTHTEKSQLIDTYNRWIDATPYSQEEKDAAAELKPLLETANATNAEPVPQTLFTF